MKLFICGIACRVEKGAAPRRGRQFLEESRVPAVNSSGGFALAGRRPRRADLVLRLRCSVQGRHALVRAVLELVTFTQEPCRFHGA
jgi:hypothetical protein